MTPPEPRQAENASVSVSVLQKPCTEGASIEIATSLQDLAESITEPRQRAKVMQPLDDILIPILCGVVSGYEGFVDIALQGQDLARRTRKKASWNNRFMLELLTA